MIDAINDLKEKLVEGLPVITSKKQGGIFYDRFILYTNKIKQFVTVDLGMKDDHVQTMKRGICFVNSLAAIFVALPSWSFAFRD